MKAVVFKGTSVTVEEVPPPHVSERSVLIATAYSAISVGTELASLRAKKTKEGWLVTKLPLPRPLKLVLENPYYAKLAIHKLREGGIKELMKYYKKAKEITGRGRFSGYSVSGYVIGKGEGVVDYNVGDAVAAAGAGFANHAELNAVPRRLVVPVPAGLGMKEASTVALGSIALQGVRRASLNQGDTVAIVGLGLIGHLAAQIAKAYNLKVIGFDIDDFRVELARSKGIEAYNSAKLDPVQKVMELTEGFGADAVIIAASSDKPGLMDLALDMIRHKGRVVILGAFPTQFDRTRMYLKDAEIAISVSYGPGRYDPVYELGGVDYPIGYVRWTEERNMKEYLRLLSVGAVSLQGVIGAVYPIEEAPKAYEDLAERRVKGLTALIAYEPEKYLKERGVIVFMVEKSSSAEVIRKGTRPTVSFIGFGSFASNVLYPIVKELYELNGVSVTNPLKAKELLNKGFKFATTNYHEVLSKEEDIIIIATRHSQHYPILRDALKESKARIIYVEKPPVLTPEQLEDVNKLVKETDKVVVVGFNRRCSPITQLLSKLAKGKAASLLYRVAAGKLPRDHWVYEPEEGGRYLGEGCHFVDYATAVFEDREPLKGSSIFVRPDNASIIDTDVWSSSISFERALASIHYTSLNSKAVEKEYIELHVEGELTVKVYDYKRLEFFGEKAGKAIELCKTLCARYSPTVEGNAVLLSEQAKGWQEEMEQLGKLLKEGEGGCLATWEKAYKSMKLLFSMYY